jgi:adenosylhomocysteine nucleosidase
MAGLDMEMYGVYKAVELSSKNPIGAKTVADLADNAKADKYHEYGSILSARFVVDAMVVLSTRP